jgi:prepilin-type N-terminal cleavage/methylation domain-containing protein
MLRRGKRVEDRGFTLIEMMVALALAFIAFSALAIVLTGGLKALGVEKTRARANEIATQGIEGLQRLSYNALGLCTAPPGTAPAGLTDTVFLANCTSPTYAEPCTPLIGSVPSAAYTCTNLSISYSVRRYIAWGDTDHSVKRLAVFVDWTDQVGRHEVAEQSSLRSPDEGSVVGLSVPLLSNLSVTPQVDLVSGTIETSLTFSASTSGIPDSVFVTFVTLQGGITPTLSTWTLTTADNGTNWSSTIPAGNTDFVFGAGTQYITFTAYRSADGKVNSQVDANLVNFLSCQPGLVSCGQPNGPPQLSSPTTPSSVQTDTTGALCSSFSVSVNSPATTADSVVVSFQTLTGAQFVAMAPPSSGNTWTATISPTSNYLFAGASQYLYFEAAQDYNPSQGKYGQTAALQASNQTAFGGSCP